MFEFFILVHCKICSTKGYAALSTVSIGNSLLIKNRAASFNKIPIGFFVQATASTGTQSTRPYCTGGFSTCLIDSGKGK